VMKILVFAYACEPVKGSEPGAGWAWARMLAGLAEVWVITRENNRTAIEATLPSVVERDSMHFVYVDLPWWARFWKRGQFGLRPYYLLWNIAALRKARVLERNHHFHLVWHVTLANAWLGSAGALVGPPFVFGPVGGGVGIPWRFAGDLGPRGVAFEVIRAAARAAGRYTNPLARVAWRRARLVLAQNRELIDWLPTRYRANAEVFQNFISDEVAHRDASKARTRTAVFAGRLVSWKGPALALRAIALLPDWRLVFCGSGPDEAFLKRLAKRLGVADRVEFRGWLPRGEFLGVMRDEAGVFLFPSLRDDSPWAVGEAVLTGVPIVCLDRGGAPILAGGGVPLTTRSQTVTALARRLFDLSESGSSSHTEDFTIQARRERLSELLARRGLDRLDTSRGEVS
jgi:glycosyltransferase involved in cell wall biosynthesis